MKKIILLSLIIGLVSVGASFAKSDRAAFFLKDERCVIPAGALCPVSFGDLYSIDMIDVSTSGGTTSEVCHFILPEECVELIDLDKTMIMREFPCPIVIRCDNADGYIVTITFDSQIVVTPSGNVVAVCKDKKSPCP